MVALLLKKTEYRESSIPPNGIITLFSLPARIRCRHIALKWKRSNLIGVSVVASLLLCRRWLSARCRCEDNKEPVAGEYSSRSIFFCFFGQTRQLCHSQYRPKLRWSAGPLSHVLSCLFLVRIEYQHRWIIFGFARHRPDQNTHNFFTLISRSDKTGSHFSRL